MADRVRHIESTTHSAHGSSFGYVLPESGWRIYIHVRASLLALFATLPVYKNALQPYFPIDLSVVLSVVSVVFTIPLLFTGHRAQREVRWFATSWVGIVSLIWIGILTAPDPSDALSSAIVLTAATFLPTWLSFPTGRERRAVYQFLLLTFWIGAAVSATAFFQQATQGQFARATVYGTNPILIGIASTWVPLIGFTVLWSTRPTLRVPVLLLSSIAIPVSVSAARGPLIAAVVALGLVSVLRGGKAFAYAASIGGLILVALPIIRPLMPEFGVERFGRLTDSVNSIVRGGDAEQIDDSLFTRSELFAQAWEMFINSPLLGGGTRSFAQAMQNVPHLDHLEWPHNILLQFAAEYGVVGVAIAGFTFVAAALKIVSCRNDTVVVGCGALFIASFIEAQFSGNIDNRMLWSVTFLLIAVPWNQSNTLVYQQEGYGHSPDG